MASARARSDRDWAAWITAAILLVVLVGFGRSFFLAPVFAKRPEWGAPELLFYLHGAVFAAWFALLACQTWLIRARSVALHRQLGYWGAGLAAGIFALGIYVALAAANRSTGYTGVPVPPEQFLLIPLLDMATFGPFVLLGVINRSRPASHKRWMLLASITLLGAPVARLPFMLPWLPVFIDVLTYAVFILALAAWDWDTRQRLSRETVWGGGAILIPKTAALWVMGSAAWSSAGVWLMQFGSPP